MALLSPRALLVTSPSPSLLSSSAAASFPAYTYRPPTSSVSSTRQSGGRGFPGRRVEGAAPSRLLLRAASSSASPSSVASSADVLRDVAIYSALTGEPVLFGDLWDQNEGMAVVALLRHFGCFCCWELASVLRDAKSRFDSAGVKLIAVGVGTPDKARILAERDSSFILSVPCQD